MWETIAGELWHLISVLVAVGLGFAIGYERKLRFKEAGIRTHTIVCAGSALIMVVSKYGFDAEHYADASRIAAQIVSGIGFLGAGIIVYRQHEIHGLTTAAGVWATAGVGMAAGAGMYVLAAGVTVLLIAVQCLFHLNCRVFRTKRYFRVIVRFDQAEGAGEKVMKIFDEKSFTNCRVQREEGEVSCKATLNTSKELSPDFLKQVLAENEFIRTVDWCDED